MWLPVRNIESKGSWEKLMQLARNQTKRKRKPSGGPSSNSDGHSTAVCFGPQMCEWHLLIMTLVLDETVSIIIIIFLSVMTPSPPH